MAGYLAHFLVFLATVSAALGISCLVVRPGYGLVSEQCPPSAIGCRIRVMSDRIDWYEWAKLYDRNQLVCVYPEEYRSESGCQKKASGSVRCWCGGSDDCNNAENSKELYERYIGPLEKKKELHSNRTVHTTTQATTTTTTRRTTTKKVTPKVHVTRLTTTRRPVTTVEITTTTTTKSDFPETNLYIFKIKARSGSKAHLLPTDDRDKYDQTFESTRKALEAQMKEEDERLKQMLMDEEDEMRDNEILEQEEKSKLERKERARIEEKRRLEEEERLARIEREEAEEQERKTLEQDDEEDEDYEYGGGGALMNLNFSSSSLPLSLLTFCILLR